MVIIKEVTNINYIVKLSDMHMVEYYVKKPGKEWSKSIEDNYWKKKKLIYTNAVCHKINANNFVTQISRFHKKKNRMFSN